MEMDGSLIEAMVARRSRISSVGDRNDARRSSSVGDRGDTTPGPFFREREEKRLHDESGNVRFTPRLTDHGGATGVFFAEKTRRRDDSVRGGDSPLSSKFERRFPVKRRDTNPMKVPLLKPGTPQCLNR